jgi:hypothetical protein
MESDRATIVLDLRAAPSPQSRARADNSRRHPARTARTALGTEAMRRPRDARIARQDRTGSPRSLPQRADDPDGLISGFLVGFGHQDREAKVSIRRRPSTLHPGLTRWQHALVLITLSVHKCKRQPTSEREAVLARITSRPTSRQRARRGTLRTREGCVRGFHDSCVDRPGRRTGAGEFTSG